MRTPGDTRSQAPSVTTFRHALVPTWAKVAAWLVPLSCVPSIVWRLVDSIERLAENETRCAVTGEGLGEQIYVTAGLPVLQLGAALLTLGLIRPWGEVTPSWMPAVGGRRIPVALAAGVAATGAVIVMVIYWYGVVEDLWGPILLEEPVEPREAAPPGCADGLGWSVLRWYLPMAVWGPLLTALTIHYIRRRGRGRQRRDHSSVSRA